MIKEKAKRRKEDNKAKGDETQYRFPL